MKYPKIDLEELEKEGEANWRGRLEFIGLYAMCASGVKETGSSEWSEPQAILINGGQR